MHAENLRRELIDLLERHEHSGDPDCLAVLRVSKHDAKFSRLLEIATGLYSSDADLGLVERHASPDAAREWAKRRDVWDRLRSKVTALSNGS